MIIRNDLKGFFEIWDVHYTKTHWIKYRCFYNVNMGFDIISLN